MVCTVYGYYLKAGGGWLTVPVMVLAAILMQGSQVLNSYTLVWWQDKYDIPAYSLEFLLTIFGA
jgi:ATP-binding cassette subfamily C (CFTR/MRP) protein 1